MLSQDSFSIEDKQYTIQELTSTQGILYFSRILKTVKGAAQGWDYKNINKDNIKTFLNPGKLVEGFITNLDPQEFLSLVKGLLKDSLVINPGFSDLWFDNEFAGRYDILILLLVKIINLNFTKHWEEFLKHDFLSLLLPMLRKQLSETLSSAGLQPTQNIPDSL